MPRRSKIPQEVRERAVRMVFVHQDQHPSQWSAITSIAEKFGASPETLRNRVRRAEIDGGIRPGLSTNVRERLRQERDRGPAALLRAVIAGRRWSQ